jgi:hypothetical protein
MTASLPRLVQWSPTVLGLFVSLFVGLFALDAFTPGKAAPEAMADFAIHVTPALVLGALMVASFGRPWIGGVAFVGLALVYAATMSRGRLDWMLVVSGPLAVVGVLFLWSWIYQRGAPVS